MVWAVTLTHPRAASGVVPLLDDLPRVLPRPLPRAVVLAVDLRLRVHRAYLRGLTQI